MKTILIVFFIINFLIMIIVFPFKIRFMGHFNLIKMIGLYSLKIHKIKLLNGRISLNDGNIYIENSVNIIKKGFENNYSKFFMNEIINKIDIKKIELYFTGGVCDNSFSSAMLCGTVSSVVELIFSILSQKYENIKLYQDIDSSFGKDNLELTFDFVISISFIAIIISLLKSIKYKKQELKNER